MFDDDDVARVSEPRDDRTLRPTPLAVILRDIVRSCYEWAARTDDGDVPERVGDLVRHANPWGWTHRADQLDDRDVAAIVDASLQVAARRHEPGSPVHHAIDMIRLCLIR